MEFPIRDRWSGRIEYLYADFGSKDYPAAPFDPASGGATAVHPALETFRLGLNYRLSDDGTTTC